jgi:hypothetical protein
MARHRKNACGEERVCSLGSREAEQPERGRITGKNPVILMVLALISQIMKTIEFAY